MSSKRMKREMDVDQSDVSLHDLAEKSHSSVKPERRCDSLPPRPCERENVNRQNMSEGNSRLTARSRLRGPSANAANTRNTCSVCLSDLRRENAVTLPCGHVFHESCISTWLARRPTCPECRNNVNDDTSFVLRSVQALVDLLVDPLRSSPVSEDHGDNYSRRSQLQVNATTWMFFVTLWIVGVIVVINLSEHIKPCSNINSVFFCN